MKRVGHDVLKGLLNAMRFHHNVMDLVKDIRDIENVHDNAMLLQRLRQSHRWTVRNLASFISKLEQEVCLYFIGYSSFILPKLE
jgi:hypothetical protein